MRRYIASLLAFTTTAQYLHWAFMGLLIAPVPAWAEPTLLEQIQEKYQTAAPEDNYTGDGRLNSTLEKYEGQAPSGRNLEREIADTYYAAPPADRPVDLSGYTAPSPLQERLENSIAEARSIGAPPTPGGTAGGGIAITGKPAGALTRDADGNYIMTPSAAPAVTTELAPDQIVSAEIGHSQTESRVQDQYGDNDAIHAEGRTQINNMQTSGASDGVVLRTLKKSQEVNPAPRLSYENPLVESATSPVRDAIAGTGDWAASCNETVEETTTTIHFPVWQTNICQKPKMDNYQSCQVSRTVELPLKLVQSQGDFREFNIEVESPTKLRVTIGKKGNNYLGGSPCHVYQSKLLFELDPGYSVVRAHRSGISYDDVYKIFINGHVHENFKGANFTAGPSFSYWSIVPSGEEGRIFPLEYYRDFPMDQRLHERYAATGSPAVPSCEYSTSTTTTGEDVTAILNDLKDGKYIEFGTLLGVSGGGEGYVSFTVELNRPITPKITYTQEPEGCATAIGWTPEPENNPATCPAPANPWDPPTTPIHGCSTPIQLPGSSCKAVRWTPISRGDGGFDPSVLNLVPPMFPGDAPTRGTIYTDYMGPQTMTTDVSWIINADGYMCDPLVGQPWCVDLNRNGTTEAATECFDYDDIKATGNGCESFEANPMCREIERECAEGFLDDNGTCWIDRIEYECDIGETREQTRRTTSSACAGMLPCINGDCGEPEPERNGDFTNAMAMASVAQHMQGDMYCDDPSDPSTCRIFNGTGKFCTWETTGMGGDCCEAPEGVDVFTYVKTAYSMAQMDNYLAESAPEMVKGAYNELRQPVVDLVKPVGEMVSSAYESLVSSFVSEGTTMAGNAAGEALSATGEVVGSIVDGTLMESIQQSMMNFMRDALPDVLSEAIFTSGGTAGADAGGQAAAQFNPAIQSAMNIFGGVMMAYMVYQMIQLAMQLYSACHEYEMDTSILIAQRQCIKVGGRYEPEWDWLGVMKRQDYCCYNSMLARIVMESAVEQLGFDLTEYADPEKIVDDSRIRACKGMTPAEMAGLDWSQIDLSEWINAMIVSEILPASTDAEAIAGHRMQNQGNRETTTERTAEFFTNPDGEGDMGDRAEEIRRVMNPEDVDCSYHPRPASCEYGDVFGVSGGG